MENLWPWLVVAATGALHGLNPAAGWIFVATARSRGRARALHALAPIAAGHLAAVGMIAAAVPAALQLGLDFDPLAARCVAGALLLVLAAHHFRCHAARQTAWGPAGPAGLALWSFIAGTAHGAGLMLLPALMPLCASDLPAREITASGSIVLALAAVGVHVVAMLVTIVATAAAARRGFAAACRWVGRRRCEPPAGS